MDREGLYGGRGEGSLVAQADFARPQQQQHRRRQMERRRRRRRTTAAAAGSGGGGGGGDAASVEAGKRRRGRPPGSKNKPKPPPVVTRDVEPAAAMRPHVLEVPAGGDVARALAGFARRRGLGICVLAGTGAIADVALRHPSPPPGAAPDGAAAVVFRGRYEILSISATFLAPSMSAAVPPRAARDLSVSLAGPQGQIVGGAVAGPLVAATTVVVLAAAFTDLTFHRLPLEDDAPASAASGSAEADEHRGHQPQDPSGLRQHLHSVAPATQPVPLYGRQPSQEVWPPAASAQRSRPPYQ
ncbi:hypothetical protein PVAP13_6KG317300 [Panicum virgatum]|uniref:PPC domain-containing protein n=1 Tax=Panicum virgatum TaxID=38727 RepID=A0A8T0RET7_PANVG|nr:hypothetical protein PVAP13_6KG317300 [Panicum virgatum]